MTTPEPKGRRRPRWHPLASPLTRRILAVNLLAPVILMAGLLYVDSYKQGLIRSQLAGLATQAEMVAGAVGEGAVVEEALGFLEINREMAQTMVRRLAEPAQVRARLFEPAGELVADSRFILGAKGHMVQVEDLPPPNNIRGHGWQAGLRAALDRLASWMPEDDSLPLYAEAQVQRAEHYAEAQAALHGRTGYLVRNRPGGGLLLSAAVPVQRYKQVVGALMLTADGSSIARALFQVRVVIVEIFMVVLAITVGVSLYMAGTIARPVRRLALAAEQVRHGTGRGHAIPDLSRRGDEIGELSLALKEMTEAMWRRMDAIEAFAADVAHEIKNPLTSLRSALETAQRVTDEGQRAKLMAIVQDDIERVNRLISDISDASRLDAELSRAETQPVAVRAMVEALAEVYRSTTEEQRLTFAVAVPEHDQLQVQGIESRLVQVLRNLIANAVSFSPDGGTIRLTAARDSGGGVRIEVEDDGPGIPDNKLDAIFDRFYSERPKSEKFGLHSGLGLSISKQIVDAHGGSIRAANRTDADGQVRGARFTVKLPAE